MWEGEVERFSPLPSFSWITIPLLKDQEGPSMPICTIQSIMKKSVTSSVTVRERKWIPQRNNWKQSDSLSAQLGENQCSYLREKGLKTNLNLLSSEPSIRLNEESPPFNYKLAEVVNHHSKCYAFQSYNQKSSRLFSRGGTPSTCWTISIPLHPSYSSALVCLLWLAEVTTEHVANERLTSLPVSGLHLVDSFPCTWHLRDSSRTSAHSWMGFGESISTLSLTES